MAIRNSSLVTALIAVSMLLCLTLLPRDAAIAQQAPDQAAGGAPALELHGAPLSSATLASGPVALSKSAKLASDLDQLQRADALDRASGGAITRSAIQGLPDDLRAGVASNHLLLDDAGRVQVLVETAGEPATSMGTLMRFGMTVERSDMDQRLIQGRLPIPALREAADLPDVVSVRAPERAVLRAGAVTSQGDSILGAPSLRSTYGADGSNVRVGVISDGMEGLAASRASGDLPAVNITTCNKAPSGTATDAGAGAEGTAMSEIVHDLAPGAEIWFGYFNITSGTELDFEAAVNCLAQNTDVVLDDIGWFGVGPYDGTSSVSMNATNALNNATNRIRGYYTAVGNDAQRHYEEAYNNSGYVQPGNTPGDSWTLHRYAATGTTTDAGFGLACQTSPTLIPNCGDEVQLGAGGSMSVILEWNDAWGSSANDYDLFLLDETANILYLASADRQTGAGSDPIEGFSFTNTSGTQRAYDIIIGNYKGTAAPRTFNEFINCHGCAAYSNGSNHNFNTMQGSVSNNSDAGGGVISSGAIFAGDPGNDNIETFSARGPTADNRTKPDITAIDGVSVTGDGGFPSTFFGTSATSPHVGAIAALVLTCKPSLKKGEGGDNPAADRTALRNALLNSAVDLGTPGNDNTFGAGRINAPAAAAAAGCLPDADGDGCPDAKEQGANPLLGGARDAANQWDFFDVPTPALAPGSTTGTRSRVITLSDVLAVLYYVGTRPGGSPNLNGVSYDADLNKNGIPDGREYDRTPSSDSTKPWRSGPPNGAVSLWDVLVELAQVGDNCTT